MAIEYGAETCLVQGEVAPSGTVLLYDDMEGRLKWQAATGWPAGRRYRIGEGAYQGNYGLRLIDRVVVPNGPGLNFAGRGFGPRSFRSWKLECAWRGSPGSEAGYYFWVLEGIHGGKLWTAGVAWDSYYGNWYLANGTYSWYPLSGFTVDLDKSSWHRLSLQVNLARAEYRELQVDGAAVDLRGNNIGETADAGGGYAKVILGIGFIEVGTLGGEFDCVLVKEV